MTYLARNAPGRFDGHIRVITDDVHTKTDRGVCDPGADVAETDDPEGLSHDLGADIVFLAGFDLRLDVLAAREGTRPEGGVHDVAGGKNEGADRELHNRLGVRAGGVEDDDALFRAALDGNIIRSYARTANCQEPVAKLYIVELRGADEQRVGILRLDIDHNALGAELVEPCLGDVVHGFDFKHDALPQIPSYSPPAP